MTQNKAQTLTLGPPLTIWHWPYEVPKSAQPPISYRSDFHGGCRKIYPWTRIWGDSFLKRLPDKRVWKNIDYNQNSTDYAIINSEPIKNNCLWRERVHENALTFYGIAQQLAGYYNLENFVSDYLILHTRVTDRGVVIIKSMLCQDTTEVITTGSKRIYSQGGGHSPWMTWICGWKRKRVTRMSRTSHLIPSSCLESWIS